MWLSWLKHCPINWKVSGFIPGQGTCVGCGFSLRSGCIWEATDWCFSLPSKFCSPNLSLPSLSSVTVSVKWADSRIGVPKVWDCWNGGKLCPGDGPTGLVAMCACLVCFLTLPRKSLWFPWLWLHPVAPWECPGFPRGFAAKKRGYADQLSLLIVLVLSQMNKLAVLLVWCESLENVDNVSLTPQASPPLGGDNYTDCYWQN